MSEHALHTLKPGEKGVIHHLETRMPQVRQRLLELGLIKGAPVQLIRFAPMGDPIEVQVGSFRLSLRKTEAASIMIMKDAVQ